MKNAAVASRAGEIRRITTTHLGDGQPLTLTVQVWLLLRILLQDMPMMLQTVRVCSHMWCLPVRVAQHLCRP